MSTEAKPLTQTYSAMNRAPHTLYESRSSEDFVRRFEAATGCTVQQIIETMIDPTAPRAVILVGSIALGMAASASDVDLIVLVDDRSALVRGDTHRANSAQELEFSSPSDAIAATYLTMREGIVVETSVAIAPAIEQIYTRLRGRGQELSETEIRVLGRLTAGWLLSQTDGYTESHAAILKDPALLVYCCTKAYVSALHEIAKSKRALQSSDMPLALNHGRLSVEAAFLAYFASEGLPYLGTKWLAQVGHAQGAAERVARHPLLVQGIALLFPQYPTDRAQIDHYLASVSKFMTSMRALIEQKTRFRIAFQACPQIHSLE